MAATVMHAITRAAVLSRFSSGEELRIAAPGFLLSPYPFVVWSGRLRWL